jgi:hypothetical protein
VTPILLTALREALQCSLIASVVVLYHQGGGRGRDQSGEERSGAFWYFMAGVLVAFSAGFSLSYHPWLHGAVAGGTWSSYREMTEAAIYFTSIALLVLGLGARERLHPVFLSLLGFTVFFFEAGSLWFLVRETAGETASIHLLALAGTAAGFLPIVVLSVFIRRMPAGGPLALPGFFLAVGALKFATGGLSEVEPGSILINLQRGIHGFLESSTTYLRETLLLTGQSFLHTPLSGLFGFLATESVSMLVMVVALMAPPVLVILHLLSVPDPLFEDVEVKAQRRLATAFFRKDLIRQSVPFIASFFVLFFLIHAVNLSLNPMFEPVPEHVRADDTGETLRIPLSGTFGDLTDGKLRKLVYFYGDTEIILLAILKPDGSIGLGLDECEICNPADWNTAARGYGQRGENLVCKYCMTPIAVSSMNKPGGCNPIPVPFTQGEAHIIVSMEDLLRVHRAAEGLDKKGSHL